MNYQFHDKIILRTPLKPLKASFSKEELKAIFEDKGAKEALFLASPDLSVEMEKWLAGEINDKAKEEKLMASLHKYALRMHSRCTPFGLFANCMVTQWGERSEIRLNPDDLYRSTRLDMHFSCQLAQKLAEEPFIKPFLKFFPSTSIYAISDKLRYVEYSYQNKARKHQISAVDRSVYLDHIFHVASEGSTIRELAQSLPKMDAEITFEEAEAFINQLIEEQLLVSEIEPSVSGEELMIQIYGILERIENEHPSDQLGQTIEFVKTIMEEIKEIDQLRFNTPETYKKIAAKLEKTKIPYELSKLFQTDLFYHSNPSNQLDRAIAAKIRKAARLLNRITQRSENTNLKNFREKFYERYEEAELPLLSVLDNEWGIGYASNTNHTGDNSPLVNDLGVPGRAQEGGTPVNWTKYDSIITKKLIEAVREGKKKVTLDESTFKDLNENWEDIPDSISIMFSMVGDQPFLKSIGGSSAINLLGRFAAGNNEIKEVVESIEQIERGLNSDKVLSEIVHLPEARTGNILMRPSFRSYEIPYLSKSNLPFDQQLSLDDLMVSVRNDRIILRSKRLNKIVEPRLGNAHNYSFRSLPVYHFLCDLQTYNKRSGLYFHWGKMRNEFNFLPRVEINEVIVEPATWNLSRSDFDSLIKKGENKLSFKEWHKSFDLPVQFLLSEGDNELLINSEDPMSIATFLTTIKNKHGLTLKEFLFADRESIIQNKEGDGYTNEFVATLVKTENKVDDNQRIPNEPDKNSTIQRNFTIGSEWLYYKIYCGTKTADEIVGEVFSEFCSELIQDGLIDKWFFIRYGDPEMHLRVRFHFTDTRHIGTVIQRFNEAFEGLLSEGLIWKIQAGTYQRELERYGENTIELAESLFYFDSQTTSEALSMLEFDAKGEKIRWLFALRSVDQLLEDLQFKLEEKNTIMAFLRDAFAEEHGLNKHLNKQIDKKYRADKKEIEDILNRANDKESELKPLTDLLAIRSEKNAEIITELKKLSAKNELRLGLDNFTTSYIHMLLNRLFKNKQRLHELVIYDFLSKKYRSEVGRKKAEMKKIKTEE